MGEFDPNLLLYLSRYLMRFVLPERRRYLTCYRYLPKHQLDFNSLFSIDRIAVAVTFFCTF
jgi:hypothetical protein